MSYKSVDCNEWGSFIVGVIVGGMIMILFLTLGPSKHAAATKALHQCEKNLPRTQTCVITAVVNTSENK